MMGLAALLIQLLGVHYFDRSRDTGYGGYRYDGRWKPVAEAVVERYGLSSQSRVLDIGCAKAFFLADLLEVCPGIEVRGIDVSEYALSQAPDNVKPLLTLAGADALPFPDHYFDFVAAFNTLQFLDSHQVKVGFREMLRVGKGKSFIQVDSFNNDGEKERIGAWAPFTESIYSPEKWLQLFSEVGYNGDYYWTIVQPGKADG